MGLYRLAFNLYKTDRVGFNCPHLASFTRPHILRLCCHYDASKHKPRTIML